ncbi:MAG: sulfur oxidation c-type cytochrome SoxX [Comamonas sp. SCN 67-35]|uniref:sulfur oxidation c-type cytochrome SoxX n=1 Tax=unclassified Comamonas TaxID=2638500 RepID=UPI000868D991|nr:MULTISPECIES: sulfur oxidation c-type cytochrome SoxX [unclassified Comamonas]MBN9331786.1 sulfur oxidation c-type cytochrome SoxX [Comamonas sp.]ODU36740.1 MAG: sulfur oxidation c-type cytochrome SoxX [Comamonas sp. SCN 67-35]OJW97876.1 MAG: sulfur oxidation c-type cytochrome SoxX [Burkholderiales bacterium 66-26]
MKKSTALTATFAVIAVATLAGCAGSNGASTPSTAELDAMAQKMVQQSFHDKGIVKVKEALAADETLRDCDAAAVAGHTIDAATEKKLEAANFKTIQWPANGKYLGDWKSGEKIAQSGRGRTWNDKADSANGGNCYNCHQISKEEISYGTIGPSLYHYARLKGVTDPNSPEAQEIVKYTWGKIWNAKAYNACSNMPRAGTKGILTQAQVADIVALLLDPKSPVNR